ncbi:MAG: NPCBM/NEW2 domain-containing protein [Phycisphaeraceae bacterium]
MLTRLHPISSALAATLLALVAAPPAPADIVQSIDEPAIGGKVALEPGSDTLSITDEQGNTRNLRLVDLDEVRFGEDLVAVKSGDLLLIRNDRMQTQNRESAKIKLRAGLHRIVVPYWQAEQQFSLSLRVSGPGINGETELGGDHLRCFRDPDETAEPSPGIDPEGFRLPELPLDEKGDRRRFLYRANYRFYVGDDAMPFENVGVLRRMALKRSGSTTAIDTGVVTEPNQYIGLVFEAFFVAEEDGEYNFALTSDDGSQLYFGQVDRFKAEELGIAAGPTPWRLVLHHDGAMFGEIANIADGRVRTKLALGDEAPADASIALGQVESVWDTRVDPASIKRDNEPADQDTIYFRDKQEPGKILSVSGTITGLSDTSLSFVFRGAARSLDRDRVLGLVFNDVQRPEPAEPGFHQTLRLRTGQVLPCKIVSIGERVVFELIGGSRAEAPRVALISLRCEDGRRVDLTAVTPTAEEAIPYFGPAIPARFGESFEGAPIRLYDDQAYERAIAVHSKSRLYYKLERPCQRFRARFGMMSPGGKLGDVTARVLGDGEVLWEQAGITAETGVIDVDVQLAGVQRLVLEVDYGQGQHVGDRAAWCNPELIYADAP